MEFEFATATRIVFGRGKLAELGSLVNDFGRRALIVTGRGRERSKPVVEVLASSQIPAELFHLAGEPTVEEVRRGAQLAKEAGCDFVIGFGGGSALDAAKAIAAMQSNPGDLLDYLEVVGRAQPLRHRSVPCVTIPTTAGTGAEVTRNAVLASPEHRFKVSLRSPLMLPALALVDPDLTRMLPAEQTATTGMDAVTQLIEPFVSHRANPFTDALCRDGLQRVGQALRRAYQHGDDLQAREDMSLGALWSGLALANAALGAVHGLAAPLGGMFSASHGAICAALLASAMRTNIQALEQRQADGQALRRYAEVACLLTGHSEATAQDGTTWVRETCAMLRIQSLGKLGVRREEIPEIVKKAAKASSMKGNPIALSSAEIEEILERSL